LDNPEEEALQIPSFLDATLNFDAKKVLYDNLTLKNTKGSVKINDQTAYLQNVTSNIFDGGLTCNGKVSTKTETPNFAMNLDLSNINIVKSFSSLEMLQGFAPIAKALTGALTTQININGNLSDDLTPVLNSLKGNALAKILNAKVNTSQTPLLSNLDEKLSFVNFNTLNLKDIKTSLSFDDGNIKVKPFVFDVEGIKITAGGSHNFDMNMDYNVSMDVPAKYLGNEVSGLISQLNDQEANQMTVALPVGITGNFSNPKINLNTEQAVKQLTQQIIAKQKEKAKGKIVDEGTKVLTDLLGGAKKDKEDPKSAEDKPEDKLKDAAKDILGGFLGKKKKKDTTKTKN